MRNCESIKDEFSVKAIWFVLFSILTAIMFFGSYVRSYEAPYSNEDVVVIKKKVDGKNAEEIIVSESALSKTKFNTYAKEEVRSFKIAMIFLVLFSAWAALVAYWLGGGSRRSVFMKKIRREEQLFNSRR